LGWEGGTDTYIQNSDGETSWKTSRNFGKPKEDGKVIVLVPCIRVLLHLLVSFGGG
jgi:hypothetical protein